MNTTIHALACSDNYDIMFTDSGEVKVNTRNGSALADMLKLDFNSNDNWSLDKNLGIHWLSQSGDGLLQRKNSEVALVGAITRKLNSMEGIREIKSIEINRGLNRKLYFVVSVITHTNEEIQLGKEL